MGARCMPERGEASRPLRRGAGHPPSLMVSVPTYSPTSRYSRDAAGTPPNSLHGPHPTTRALEIVSTGLIARLTDVMAMVERLVPDGLWELFQRVVPAAPMRPQGGGRRRYGDRQVLAAIVFVATTGCTWRQLPPIFGPSGPTAHRLFTEWSRARVWGKLHRSALDELGARGALDWSRCAIDSVNMRAAKGGPDGSESGRSRQEGLKDPLDHRADRSAHLHRDLCRQHS